jgi:hypothetical protein
MILHQVDVPLTSTNWSTEVTVPLFDAAVGTLTGVDITLTGEMASIVALESLSQSAAVVRSEVSAMITLLRPDGSELMTAPFDVRLSELGAFDGSLDFAGTSGRSEFLYGVATASFSVSDPADLVMFEGFGDLTLPMEAMGTASTRGAGGIVASFETYASAEVFVQYTYDPLPIPAPAAAFLGALGLGTVVARRSRG